MNNGAGVGCNGDLVRAWLVVRLFRSLGCTAFVETGTYMGATAVLMARALKSPLLSCELSRKRWLIAWLRCSAFTRITVRHEDSRVFLDRLPARIPHSSVPFFYLDAHWESDLPLDGELAIIGRDWPRCVVLIDDFVVPGRPDFGYDVYDGRPLSAERLDLASSFTGGDSLLLYPRYEASQELLGARRGYAVLVRGLSEKLARLNHGIAELLVGETLH